MLAINDAGQFAEGRGVLWSSLDIGLGLVGGAFMKGFCLFAILLVLAVGAPAVGVAATAYGEGTCIEKDSGESFACAAELMFVVEELGVALAKADGVFSLYTDGALYLERPVIWFEDFGGVCTEFCFEATTNSAGGVLEFSYVQANLADGIGGLSGAYADDGSLNFWEFDDLGDPVFASGSWTSVVGEIPVPAGFPLAVSAIGCLWAIGRQRNLR